MCFNETTTSFRHPSWYFGFLLEEKKWPQNASQRPALLLNHLEKSPGKDKRTRQKQKPIIESHIETRLYQYILEGCARPQRAANYQKPASTKVEKRCRREQRLN